MNSKAVLTFKELNTIISNFKDFPDMEISKWILDSTECERKDLMESSIDTFRIDIIKFLISQGVKPDFYHALKHGDLVTVEYLFSIGEKLPEEIPWDYLDRKKFRFIFNKINGDSNILDCAVSANAYVKKILFSG